MRELQKNCSTGCSLRHEGDNKLIGRPRLPLQNPTWPTILPDLSHRCQFHPLSVFALHFLAALLELTLKFSLVVRRRFWAFLHGALAVQKNFAWNVCQFGDALCILLESRIWCESMTQQVFLSHASVRVIRLNTRLKATQDHKCTSHSVYTPRGLGRHTRSLSQQRSSNA